MSTMTRTTAYAVLSRAVAAQRNGSAPEQVSRLDAALAVAGEVLLAAEDAEAMPVPPSNYAASKLCMYCGQPGANAWDKASDGTVNAYHLNCPDFETFKAHMEKLIKQSAPLLPVKPDGN